MLAKWPLLSPNRPFLQIWPKMANQGRLDKEAVLSVCFGLGAQGRLPPVVGLFYQANATIKRVRVE
jgi:hypothetical protein